MPTYILASQSPRRQQLLAEMGISFSVQQADIDETPPADINVYEVPQVLAQKKAEKIASTQQEAIVIAADTVVIINNTILNKPKDKAEAKKMLQGGGVAINKEKIELEEMLVGNEHLINNEFIVIQKGKKNNYLITVE